MRAIMFGTSLSAESLLLEDVQKQLNLKELKFVKAFTLGNDGAYKPWLNVEDLSRKINFKWFDIAIVKVGVNEISNLKSDYSGESLVYNKMKQLINPVIKWTDENENKAIILIDRMIRTDSKLKYNLTKYSNIACREVLKAHVGAKQISCIDLGLEEQNEFDMFGKIGTKVKTYSVWKKQDGIHFRGKLGRELFTQQF